jgi:hypothetical protein
VGRLNWVTVLVALAAGGAIVLAVRRRRAGDLSR